MQRALARRLMRAYLVEGKLLSDHAVLARLAVEVGLEASLVERAGAQSAESMLATLRRAWQWTAAGFRLSDLRPAGA